MTCRWTSPSASRGLPRRSAPRSGYGNANRPVNAVPYVCEAPPGILSTFKMPHIIPKLG